jgi:hypothetical protein
MKNTNLNKEIKFRFQELSKLIKKVNWKSKIKLYINKVFVLNQCFAIVRYRIEKKID